MEKKRNINHMKERRKETMNDKEKLEKIRRYVKIELEAWYEKIIDLKARRNKIRREWQEDKATTTNLEDANYRLGLVEGKIKQLLELEKMLRTEGETEAKQINEPV
jgi:hypothetical protein